MVKLKLSIAGSNGKAYSQLLTEQASLSLVGKKVGQKIDGSLIGFKNYEFLISGGSDNAGFPLRKDVQGIKRQRVLVKKGPGFKPKGRVYKRRKTLRGNTIAEDVVQVNLTVAKKGSKKLESFFKKEKTAEQKKKE